MRRLLGAMILTLFLIGTVTCFAALPNMQNIAKPNPEPSAQTGWDIFAPPVTTASAAASTPTIAEWTRTGVSDDTLALTGDLLSSYTSADEGKDTQFLLYGQTTVGNGVQYPASVQRLDSLKAAITLPSGLPAWSTYLMWPKNSYGYGYPVAVNRTDAWWVGPDDKVTRGDTVSVYGRNLSHDNGTSTSWVYVKPAGSSGWWATVTSVNPYRVQFTVPASCTNGTYEVWVHNGHGGSYGWSGPLTFVVSDAYSWNGSTFNVTSYGATGNGVTDDWDAIQSAYLAARTYRDSSGLHPTLYFPAGTYMVRAGIAIEHDIRYMGAGMNSTYIKCHSLFPTVPEPGYRYGLLQGSGNNFEVKDMTLDANYNFSTSLNSPALIWMNSGAASHYHFTNVRLQALMPYGSGYIQTMQINNQSYLAFTGCEFIGGHLFSCGNRQVSFQDCDFWGANDATSSALYIWLTPDTSMVNCTAQDYNINDTAGCSLGRLISGSAAYTSQPNFYVADCVTTNLAPRVGLGGANDGEQIMCEAAFTQYEGNPTSATSTTVTFSDLNGYTDNSGLLVNQYAVIINGKGMGQYRKITAFASSTKTITVSPAWNVTPDTGSKVLIEWAAPRWIIYNNYLDGKNDYATRLCASYGFASGYDWVAAQNTVNNMSNSGVALASIQQYGGSPGVPINSIMPCYWNYYTNNLFQNCYLGIAIASETPGATDYGPGLVGNVFRNNQFTNINTIGMREYNAVAAPGIRIDTNVFEHNTFSNLPKGVGFDDYNAGARSKNNVLYKNTFSLGTAPYSGSFAVEFGSNTQLPDLRQNTWTGFASTYTGSTPGAILEVPTRKLDAIATTNGSSQTVDLTIWNAGTASLSWTASDDAAWLTLSSASGSITNENNSSTITLTCNPSGVAAGTYTGTVTITGASQTKKVIVTFTVNPAMPSGSMILWLKADTGVTKDGSNMVSQWADQSGAGNNVTPYWTYQTEYIASAINGKPALYFDGTVDNLRKVLSTQLPGTFTYFAVCSSPYTQAKQTQGGTNNRVLDFIVAGTPAAEIAVENGSTAPFEPVVKTGVSILDPTQSMSILGLGTMFNSDGTCGGDFAFTGYIPEVIVYNRALTTQETSDVITYLNNKYAIPVNPGPTVSITAPTGGFSSAAPATINITASASDSDGVSKVEFYNNGILLGTDTSSAGGWTYSWTNVEASGSSGIVLTAKAYDKHGMSTVSSSVSGTVTDSALKCYWKLDSTSGTSCTDSSGTGNTGTTSGSPTWTAGKVLNCLNFNGSSQYAQKTTATGLPVASADQTQCFWMYVSANPTVRKTAMCVSNGTTYGTFIGFASSTTFGVWRSSYTNIVTTTSLPTAGYWHHIAYVKSGSNRYLYIDGAQAATSTSATDTQTPDRINVARSASGANYWAGMVDEARVYNRVLSLTEIQSLAAGKQ